MSQIVYSHTCEDFTTGEIKERTFIKKEVKNQEMFVRTYIEDIGALAKCSGAEQSVILCCLKYLDYNTNELILNKQRRNEICECGGLKLNTVNTAISRLYKKSIFVKHEDRVYLNPKLFFYGSDIARNQLFELKIQYQIKDSD